MKKTNENEVIDAIGDLRDLMVAKFEQVDSRFERVESRLDRLEHNQNLHTNVLDKHTKMLIDFKHEQLFALNRSERTEKDVLALKKKLKTL
jgi:hypothetical protein